MQQNSGSKGSLLFLLGLVLIAGLVYYFFFRRSSSISYEQQQMTILEKLGEASKNIPKLSTTEQQVFLSVLDSNKGSAKKN